MHIELIDLLRCPREHEETWLVAAFSKMDGRFVVAGRLGCPVCSASFEIAGGIADFRSESAGSSTGFTHTPGTDGSVDQAETGEAAMMVAAMLNLSRPGLQIVLTGDDACMAPDISALTECRVIAINPSAPVAETERVATVLADLRIPLATSSFDGVLLGDGTDSRFPSSDAARVLKPGGRIVVPVATGLPPQTRELARDSVRIVGETTGALVELRR